LLLLGLLAGAGAAAALTGIQVWRQRGRLEPRGLLQRFVVLAVACAALTGLGVAEFVQTPDVPRLFDLLLGVSMVAATLWGAHKVQQRVAALTPSMPAEPTS